jgi:peptide/nickel transport system substrate-binding protein
VKRLALVALMIAALAAAAAGCGSSTSGDPDTLTVPFLADMSVPDPDVFYDIEGNSVILAQYEGLLEYAPDTTEIKPLLARSYTVSPDELTYTFKLQSGVKFHDGTKFDSKAAKASLERRTDVNSAPAYMLANVASIKTPDPLTLVIHLKSKVGPFLHYLASSWGPKMIGPKAINDNAGKDFGQSYLKTHGDGTGPYKLAAFNRGREYVLTRNDDYWGDKASFTKVVVKIVPDIGTQRLQLDGGDFDAVLHSFPAAELDSAKSNDSLDVREYPSFLRALLYLNTNKAPFSDAAARKTLANAVDVKAIVAQAYGSSGTVPDGPYPPQILSNQPKLPYVEKAQASASGSGHGDIVLAYTADESGIQRRVAEMLQTQIGNLGYKVKLKEVQLPQVYEYINDLGSAPDLLLMTNTPDGAHPDTWARILWQSKGGLNFLGFKDARTDQVLDQAYSAPKAKADDLYREAGRRLVESNAILFLANVKDVMVLRDSLEGGDHVLAYPWMLSFESLSRK